MRRPLLALSCLLGLVAASGCRGGTPLPGSGADAGRTVIYRDEWGVPHLYAPSAEAGFYAMGWAQAEDRPEQLLTNLAIAMGEHARVAGPDAIDSDLRALAFDHYGIARRRAGELPQRIRVLLRAFARGIEDFYRVHPADRPAWWGEREVDEAMILAFGRLFLYGWSIGEAYAELERGGVEADRPREVRGSNQWAVSPARSASGHALLLIDPHLSWWGPSRFWELRVHAGELRGSGVTLAGFPFIGLGHNAKLAWAMTTGGPDTADVYALQLDPSDPTRYRYDGGWRELVAREVSLEVKGEGERRFTLWSSHHGPLIAREGDRAWAARTAYADVVGAVEAWYELAFAEDYRGAVRALETLTVFPQNVMVADTAGNIYYQRTGRVPRRPEGPDWSRPVDGSTPATEWLGIHPASDHLQLLNPPQGWMQNCNVPPDAMLPGAAFSLEATRPYLYGSLVWGERRGWSNARGARAVELLSADGSVTVEEAMAWALDVRPFGVQRWLALLSEARQRGAPSSDPGAERALQDLLSWDGELRRDSGEALRYAYWREELARALGEQAARELASRVDDWYAPVSGRTPAPVAVDAALGEVLLGAFERAAARAGGAVATWGDRFRVGREGRSWPVGGGGDAAFGLVTLRNVGYGRERADATRWAERGQSATQLVELSEPIRSWLSLPVGQSDRPGSPHFADQAERLFGPRALKPSRWLPEDLAGHVVSRVELQAAPGR
jgi:acyl-homoserine lactone acylase PvdQ